MAKKKKELGAEGARRPRPLRTSRRREMIHGNNAEVRLGREEGGEGGVQGQLAHSLSSLLYLLRVQIRKPPEMELARRNVFWGPHEHSSHVIYFSRLGIFLVSSHTYSASVITAGLTLLRL